MDNKDAISLLEKHRTGKINPQERALLESWYLKYQTLPSELKAEDLQYEHDLGLSVLSNYVGRNKVGRLWPRIAVAAAAVAAITLGTWLYLGEIASSRNASRNDEVVTSMSDIKPGSVGATLTLANGKTIKLSEATTGELAKQAGVTIKKTADGQLLYEIASSQNAPRNDDPAPSLREGTTKQSHTSNTLTTAKGETYQVKLPDGTAVWLNAASSLTYVANLMQNGQRRVKLSGEAYFQVAKDKKHPFIVESKGQEVTVLGTHFNINAYADEAATKTTLLEGSVGIAYMPGLTSSSLRGKRSDEAISKSAAVYLKPNQQSIITGNNRIEVQAVDPDLAVAWKNNNINFDNSDIKYIMRQISRWYNVEVVYTDVPEEKFFGSVSRFDHISSVLRILESTNLVHFKLDGRKLYVGKNKF